MEITPETRRLSGKAVGARGSGKTLYAAYQTFCDFQQGVGSIVIDPLGSLSNYILGRILKANNPALWKKVIYVPVGGMEIDGETWVIPTPFLYKRTDRDRFQDQTARVNALWARLSPQQENAPVQGMPAIKRTTNYAGMLLAAMGNQLVPDSADLIESFTDHTVKEPSVWTERIEAIRDEYPDELRKPAKYFLKRYPSLRASDQMGQVATYLTQVDPYVLNPRLSAQYGAKTWGVDLKLAEQGYLLLFDFHLLPDEERKTGVTWLFTRCMELFRARGPRRDVVGFVVDELSRLVDRQNSLLEGDLKELIQLGRNNGISCFFTYQEVTQPPFEVQNAMNMVGYSLYAGTSDHEASLQLARMLDPYDPTWIKDQQTRIVVTPTRSYQEPIYHQELQNIYYSVQEQELIHAEKYKRRPGLTFAVTMARAEGSTARPSGVTNIRAIRDSQLFDETYIIEAKHRLVRKHGRRVSDVLEEIQDRCPDPLPEQPERPRASSNSPASQQVLMDAPKTRPPLPRSN